MQHKKVHLLPRVECPDALLLANPEEGMEHASVSHLHILGLTLHLKAGLSQVDGKRPCGSVQLTSNQVADMTDFRSFCTT